MVEELVPALPFPLKIAVGNIEKLLPAIRGTVKANKDLELVKEKRDEET